MSFENILTDNKDGVLVITINREKKLNALNKNTIAEVGKAVHAAQTDDSVKVIILTGAGEKAFIAGADISEFADFSESEAKELARHGHNVFNSVEASTKLVIAAVNGFALGGGCELAMACHLRITSDNALFGQPEVKLGLTPGYGGTQRLAQLVGKGKAIELLCSADMMNAEDALKWGLVNYVVKQEELMERCMKLARKVMRQAPLAVSACIKCVNEHFDSSKNGYETEISEFGTCFVSEDFKEGTAAFLEKRNADFKGK
ncbi:MAG: enoyl-CoA hydratase [Bacteroidia bacterium]|nr:enoyl-CoA hydratase [Bacteroidia bacterium]